ncbi:methylated-DNA--[protein]-cysteine S-methyltransferase [Clostridium manihotivorum]|uniref:Methylated-DNA--protein-cysteine methyltransferase n=1 Tax=Clostridium manihotivorum TaxID=2320868 RepID=A0A410DNV4_9CLOT|nr:methylated-DNA--[protein]-cysteine S-methyltransferase [Clostridium manihotivorum]QAA30755.1 cysteine methyltransferase [Clostridium manihotivorum]
MDTKYKSYYNSPIGTLEIIANETHIIGLNFVDSASKDLNDDSPIINSCLVQLDEYFNKQRTTFELPLDPEGTEFQKKVWEALITVDFGCIKTYKDIAISINNPKAVRAVGGANNKNPILLIIPCHRIIGSSGKLVGYGGGLWRKEWLLNHENIQFKR